MAPGHLMNHRSELLLHIAKQEDGAPKGSEEHRRKNDTLSVFGFLEFFGGFEKICSWVLKESSRVSRKCSTV